MCWSGEASAVLAATGLATTAYAAWKKEPAPLWVALGYFSLMEALQAYTYSVIDQCALPANQVATLLGYLHIAIQPFLINAVALYFVPAAVRGRLTVPVYVVCLAGTVFTLLQMYPFAWAGRCDPAQALCAERLCSVHGKWHIAWEVPVNGMGNWFGGGFLHALIDGYPGYVLPAFIVPLLYGSWRIVLFHLLVGPTLAQLTTRNHNEWPAVWCLLSIGILMLVIKTPLRQWLRVSRWMLWPRHWIADAPVTVATEPRPVFVPAEARVQ